MLEQGGVVALPTDTVYGVAASIDHPSSVVRLFALKDRDESKPVAVLVSGVAQLATLATTSPLSELLTARFWPGPLTIVLPRNESFGLDLGGAGDTVGVRSPAHTQLLALCERVGPIATTSANRSGAPTPSAGAEVAVALEGTGVDLILDGGDTGGNLASTVVRVDGGECEVLRSGPISDSSLRAAARGIS